MKSLMYICLLAIALWGMEYYRRALWEPDEARYAYVAREMQWDSHWAVLHRHSEYYSHKPPLMFWAINFFSIFNGGEINGITARLPSMLGAVFSMWAAFSLAKIWFGPGAGVRTVLIMATTFLIWYQGGTGQIDSLLCGLEMMALLMLVKNDIEPRFWKAALAYMFVGLAFLAKGPVGVVIPVGAYIAGVLASGRRRDLAKWHWLLGALIVPAFAAAWLVMAWYEGAPPAFFHELIFRQTAGRVLEGTPGHTNPFYYYLADFPLHFLPWTFFLPALFAVIRRGENRQALRFLSGWFIFVIVFFTLVTDKRGLYILFAYPAAALLLAGTWDLIPAHAKYLGRFGVYSVVALLAFVAIFIPLAHNEIELPFDEMILWPLSAILMGGVAVLVFLYSRYKVSGQWLKGFAAVMLVVQVYVSTVIYPALNPMKTPVDLVEGTKHLIKKGDVLLLYRMNGEILSYYTQSRGRVMRQRTELVKAMRTMKKGVAVFNQQGWEEVREDLGAYLKPHYFTMGKKLLIWSSFDVQ